MKFLQMKFSLSTLLILALLFALAFGLTVTEINRQHLNSILATTITNHSERTGADLFTINKLSLALDNWRLFGILCAQLLEDPKTDRGSEINKLRAHLKKLDKSKLLCSVHRFSEYKELSFFQLQDAHLAALIAVEDGSPSEAFHERFGCGQMGEIVAFLLSDTSSGSISQLDGTLSF